MVEAAALTGAALGVEAFAYNRQNYMYDRQQRRTKEYTEINFRIQQAAQWREDVRDIVGLQEKKSKTYCLVAVITLGFSMSLWCQGRLPMGTPTWIMLGNQVAAGAGFCFLTMVIWLGIYASVSAQGYHCRLLTQLVRLPVPTWQEVESCRTYGSSFEKLEGRQLFRVPFLTGPQERLVTQGNSTSTAPESYSSGASQVEVCGSGPEAMPTRPSIATDPWGLESRGDHIYELGCRYGKDAAEMRHIKLVRHAALFWQSYDAFARISLTIGINQVMLGISYFILGNMAVSLKAPSGAYGGVFALMAMAGAIGKLDMSLAPFQQVLMNVLLFAGPMFACIASYHVSGTIVTAQDGKVARFWACAAFICHGMMSLCMCLFCRVRETATGDYVPDCFKSVLWLDAFGWLSQPGEESNVPDILSPHEQALPSTLATTSQIGEQWIPSTPDVSTESAPGPWRQEHVGYYALDYMQSGETSRAGDAEAAGAQCGPPRSFHPGLETVSYDAADGHSCPSNYRDFVPPGASADMRSMAGAPGVQQLNASSPGDKFFDASSFVPRSNSPEQVTLDEIMTGHDRERPGSLPWKVFRNATCLLGIVWMVAAAYQVLDAMDIVTFASFAAPGPMSKGKPHANATRVQASHPQGLLQFWKSSLAGAPPSQTPEKLATFFPVVSIIPQGLSCDPAGQRFAVTDGLSIFTAQLGRSDRGGMDRGDHVDPKHITFQETEGCTALLGEAPDDIALVCGDSGLCKVLVLHRSGNRVSMCPLGRESSGHTAIVPQQWLHQSRDPEQVAWISAGSFCRPGDDSKDSTIACISVGTTHGRVADLRLAKDSLVPERVMPEEHAGPPLSTSTSQTGVARAFNRKYVGILQPQAGSIQIFDAANDMAEAGTLTLPAQSHQVSSFCAGGGYVYILTEHQEMWRIPLPESLLP